MRNQTLPFCQNGCMCWDCRFWSSLGSGRDWSGSPPAQMYVVHVRRPPGFRWIYIYIYLYTYIHMYIYVYIITYMNIYIHRSGPDDSLPYHRSISFKKCTLFAPMYGGSCLSQWTELVMGHLLCRSHALYIYIYTHVYTHMYTYIYIYAYMWIYIYIYTYVLMYIYICMATSQIIGWL